MTIDAIPIPPGRGSPDPIFSPGIDATLSALPLMITQINAATAAMNLASTNGTSTTSMLVANASKTFVVEAGKSYVAGQTVKIAYTTDPTIWMLGDVTAYNIGTGVITVAVQYKQGAGTYALWTISLAPPAPVTIPSGSKTVWFQAAAPVGWTQDTTHTNKALRVVGTAGGGAGGSVAFTTAFASQAVAGSNSATTLTTAQIPAHAHTVQRSHDSTAVTPYPGDARMGLIDSTGGGANHTAGIDNAGSGGSHNHTFTGTAINLAVQYIDMLLATKD